MHTEIPAAARARYVQGVCCLLSSPCRGPKTRKHKTHLSGEQGQNTKTQNTRPAGVAKTPKHRAPKHRGESKILGTLKKASAAAFQGIRRLALRET
jgi:hypothetical protein